MVDISKKRQGPLGVASQPVDPVPSSEGTDDHENSFEWQEAARITFVIIAAAAVWFRIWEPVRTVSVIGIIGLLVGTWPILMEQGWTLHQAADAAFRELLRKHHRPISLHDALRESLRRQPANDQPKATVHRLRRV